MSELSKKIESVLFWKGEPVSLKRLSEWLKVKPAETENALEELKQNLSSRGIVLVRKEDEVMLGTAPDTSALIEELTKEEMSKDLGKAGLETLSIITYFGPITRAEIDYIRGVNSTFVLRALLIRGLIERVQNKDDQRSFLYKPSFDLITHLGLSDLKDLPEFESARKELEAFRKAQEERDTEDKARENEAAQAEAEPVTTA